jgi:arsenate reductase-like glutaredoxin family protein
MSNDDSSIIIRIFASNGCKRCKMFKEECQKFSLPHVVINANEEKNQEICDKYEVNQLPHIQIVRQNSGLVMLEYAGYIHPISFLNTFKKRLRAGATAVASVNKIDEEDILKNPGCSECKKAKAKAKENRTPPKVKPPHSAHPYLKNKDGCSSCGKKKNKKSN